MQSFGASAPLKDLAKKFGFTVEHVIAAAKRPVAKGAVIDSGERAMLNDSGQTEGPTKSARQPSGVNLSCSLDIEEFPLLLPSHDVSALVREAQRQGVTAVGLARRLIGDYLRRPRGEGGSP